ncbi:MAG: hypothetical protein CML13_03415 [Puniceicoccaceae bacterium]|nr:hypothetical protein [Puniceicoccaceae bacterium]|tara:strand:+ start:1294 stop:1827 length:534 start_codon:yes stop_codon:yes gene_type:complete
MIQSKAIITVLSLNLLSASLLPSGAYGFDRVGLRVGIDTEADVDVIGYEVFGVADTAWSWDFSNDYELLFEFEGVAAVLNGEGTTGGLLKIAPQLRLDSDVFPVELVVSSGPSYLTEEKFGDLDLGGAFQFTSSIGLDWQIKENWTLGYRYQHTSNAGIYDVNDGLNLHSVSLDCRF